MNIGGPAKPIAKPAIAAVFNAEDDDEPEEMPAEARMRMRNIGRYKIHLYIKLPVSYGDSLKDNTICCDFNILLSFSLLCPHSYIRSYKYFSCGYYVNNLSENPHQ